MQVYGTSKLANILFTRELARQALGTGLTATAFHPGWVATDLGRESRFAGTFVEKLAYLPAKTPEEGADTLAWLAAAPAEQWRSGGYYVKRREGPVKAQGRGRTAGAGVLAPVGRARRPGRDARAALSRTGRAGSAVQADE